MTHAHPLLEQLMDAEQLPEASKQTLRALIAPLAQPHNPADGDVDDRIAKLQATLTALPMSHRSFSLLSWGDADATTSDGAAPHAPRVAANVNAVPDVPARYRPIACVGVGGMGEVWCVWDRRTERLVAMKLLRDTLAAHRDIVARFIAEAHTSARLSHSNTVSVHAIGTLGDGRPYFTMDLVQGKPMHLVINEVHQLSLRAGRWVRTPDGWSLARLVEAVAKVCEAADSAHAQDILHRDIKPQNVIVDLHQRVWLVDFGVARQLDTPPTPPHSAASPPLTEAHAPGATRLGAVVGTPGYMPPEQAAGQHHTLDARSDVYALGALLFHTLTNTHPRPQHPLAQTHPTPFPNPHDHTTLPLDPTLVDLVAAATQHAPSDRLPSAAALADALRQWLEGTRTADEAHALVAKAQSADAQATKLRHQASAKRAEATALLGALSPLAPERDRLPGWGLLDEAQALEAAAQAAANARQNHIDAALTLIPSLPSAHLLMAQQTLRSFKDAETARAKDHILRHRTALDVHLSALPNTHPARVRMERYLEGEGAVTVVTEPAGAEVEIYRYEERHRRLVEVHVKTVGPTPIVELPLPMGSYLLILRKDGFAPTRYPVFIERLTHWHGVPPGGTEPLPIPLIPQHHLSPNALYIPPGHFWAGTPERVQNQIPPHRMWVDGFVIDRFPVTNQGYADFLNGLLQRGTSEAEVASHAPIDTRSEAPLFLRDDAGRFYVPSSGERALASMAPVSYVGQRDALAYAAWRSEVTGKPWRLPMELEWEKAARGVDGRRHPWGDQTYVTWTRNYGPNKARASAPIDSYPVDVSPYGMRGAAGNACDICLDFWDTSAPPPARLSVLPRPHIPLPIYVLRGGSASFYNGACNCNIRIRQGGELRREFTGIRLVRGLSDGLEGSSGDDARR